MRSLCTKSRLSRSAKNRAPSEAEAR
jgi:hypothetical protein